jgi:hypothetical protein
MWTLRRTVLSGMAIAAVCVVSMVAVHSVQSQPPPEKPAFKATPPEGQTYTGVKQCSSCHFKQYTSWKKTKHAKESFESVPAKYRATPECMICHSTGYGAATGFKSAAATPNLAGTTCEACHGPGSKHDAIAKKYANKKTLSPDEDKEVRGSIYKVLPENVCVRCHLAQNHKEHPKYDKK